MMMVNGSVLYSFGLQAIFMEQNRNNVFYTRKGKEEKVISDVIMGSIVELNSEKESPLLLTILTIVSQVPSTFR